MILYLELSSGRGRGGEIYHNHLFEYLCTKYAEAGVVGREPFPPELRNPVRHLLHNRRRVVQGRPRLMVVDIGTATRSLSAILKARRLGAKVLVVVQGERRLVLKEASLRWHVVDRVERFILQRAHIVLVNSKSTGALVQSRGASFDRMVVAPPGLECDRLPERPQPPGEPPVKLLYVGAGSRIKGLLHLVEAMPLLVDRPIELDVVAEPTRETDYWRRIQQLIDANGLTERVRFHPFQDREAMHQFYSQAHILVSPSLFEGYGMVVAEAFCYGLPVIASKAGALPELVMHEQNGLLVPPANSSALAEAIRKLTDNRALRVRMSHTNFERAKTLPDWNDFETTLDQQLAPLIDPILTPSAAD